MLNADEYWMAHVGHRVVFKVTPHVSNAYDYCSGYIVALHDTTHAVVVALRDTSDAVIALIEIGGDRFWTEVDGRSLGGMSLTTSTARYTIVVDEGKQNNNTPPFLLGGTK